MLAVIRTVASMARTGGAGEDEARELEVVESAVAELIEAAEESLNWLSSYPGYGSRQAHMKMRTALARAGGEA